MSRYYDDASYETARSALKALRKDARDYHEYYWERVEKIRELEHQLEVMTKERDELLKFRAAYEALQE